MLRLTEAGVAPVPLTYLSTETKSGNCRLCGQKVFLVIFIIFSLPSLLFSGERLHRQGCFKILIRTGSRKKSWGNNGDSSTYVRRL